jgi:3-oxoacyl-[acyl-carrier protein] reductase
MKLDLENRVVLVTGGSRGIGKDIVERLVEEGALVAFCARQSHPLKELATKIIKSGKDCLAIEADVFTPNGIKLIVEKTINHYGKLDVLVHNAGGTLARGSFSDISDEDWMDTYNRNVITLVRLIKTVQDFLEKSNQARVISISSTTAIEPGSHDPHYSAAKAALLNLVKHLSNSLASKGILVNSISPGPVLTDSLTNFIDELSINSSIPNLDFKKTHIKIMESRIPLSRLAKGIEIADLVLFLASSRSQWITGSNFRIDGGKTRGI